MEALSSLMQSNLRASSILPYKIHISVEAQLPQSTEWVENWHNIGHVLSTDCSDDLDVIHQQELTLQKKQSLMLLQ
jgi:hypothetical protein